LNRKPAQLADQRPSIHLVADFSGAMYSSFRYKKVFRTSNIRFLHKSKLSDRKNLTNFKSIAARSP